MLIKNTIAYNVAEVNKLNEIAEQIDTRLFLFAYYNPKPLLECESYMVQFFTAVINLNGLFTDCGAFIKALLNNKYSDQNAKNRFNDCVRYLSGLRNSVCHNNAQEFQSNTRNNENANKFFKSSGLSGMPTTSDEWKKCIDTLAAVTNAVEKDIINCLKHIQSSATKWQDISDWLDSISKWYGKLNSEMWGYLEDLRQLHYSKYRNSSKNLESWFQTNFVDKADKKINAIINDYLSEIEIMNILIDTSICPTPALPIDVFKLLTQDVYCFAMSNKHKD